MSVKYKMENLSVFKNESLNVSIRTVEKDGEPWFVAKDVSDYLEYSDSFAMTKRLDSDEKSKIDESSMTAVGLDTGDSVSKGTNILVIINESGLYSAILGSKKQEAKAFKKWITSEVLPSIRKTGKYEVSNNPLNDDAIRVLAESTLKLLAEKKELETSLGKANKKLESAKPKVEFFDRVIASDEYVDMVVAANYISDKGFVIGRNTLIEFLRSKLILKSKKTEKNLPYQKYIDLGYFKVELIDFTKPPKDEGGKIRECVNYKTTCSMKGLNFIIQLLKDSGYEDKKGRNISGEKSKFKQLPINK